MSTPLTFVSSNAGKIAEAQAILHIPFSVAHLELDEIQDLDIANIVQKKAETAFSYLHKPLIVDDVGLYVQVWQGFPGPFIKYILSAGGNELLLHMLAQEENRDVIVKAAIGYHDGKDVHVFLGEMKAEVAREQRGTYAFGWDPIIIPEGQTKTFGEMSRDEKNAISHRRKALEQLKAYLIKSAES